jgi:hypothetical protein
MASPAISPTRMAVSFQGEFSMEAPVLVIVISPILRPDFAPPKIHFNSRNLSKNSPDFV